MDIGLTALRRFGGALAAAKLRGKAATVFVSYMATSRCTRRCSYCDLHDGGAELTFAQFERILDQFAANGLVRMGFTGGEALLHPDLPAMLQACRRRGIISVVSTNGDLVAGAPERLAFADWVTVSLDGDRETHDRLRGQGSYDAAVGAVQVLKARGGRVLTSTVLSKENSGADLRAVDHVLDVARALDIATVWQPVFGNNAAAVYSSCLEHRPESVDLGPALTRLRSVKRHDPSRVLFPTSYLDFIEENYPEFSTDRCYAGRLFWGLAPDGKAYPCYPLLGVGPGWDLTRRSVAGMLADARPFHCARGCFCSGHIQNQLMFDIRPGVWIAMALDLLPR